MADVLLNAYILLVSEVLCMQRTGEASIVCDFDSEQGLNAIN